jgi:TRAP transporter TAXI family solute receptor
LDREEIMTIRAAACAIALGASSFVAAAPAVADFNDKAPITATVTGATPTGYPRAVVEGLNAIIRDAYPGSSVSLKPNSPGGGVLAIAEGQADFSATATGTEIKLAQEGLPPYQKPLKGKLSFVMFLHEQQLLHTLMTKAWADENGIKTWDDVAKKKPKMRLAINRTDNPQVSIGGPYEIFKVHGFSYDDIQKWGGSYVLGNSAIGLDAINDGKADVFMNARFPGDALVKDIAGKRDLLWVDADPEKMKQAAAAWDFRMQMLPKGMYAFMEKDYPAIMQWTSVIAGTHVSEETVYKFVKALAEGSERVKKIHNSLSGFSPETMVRNPANLAFHPGAARYYKEKGLIK